LLTLRVSTGGSSVRPSVEREEPVRRRTTRSSDREAVNRDGASGTRTRQNTREVSEDREPVVRRSDVRNNVNHDQRRTSRSRSRSQLHDLLADFFTDALAL